MNPIDLLQQRLAAISDDNAGLDSARISVVAVEGRVGIEFHGSPFEEGFEWLCETVCSPEVAASITSLRLRSPRDVGANGTRNWDINGLLSGPDFPLLSEFSIERNQPGDHNRIIVGSTYDEDGLIGLLVRKAPNLSCLEVPSAPDSSFFLASDFLALRHLCVDSGYSSQGFIENLARSTSFPSLTSLEFGEFAEDYVDDFESQLTPFSDYLSLFQSQVFQCVQSFVLRNPRLTRSQLQELRALRPSKGFQFRVDSWYSFYVPRP